MTHFFDESFWIAISFIIFLYFAYHPIRNAIIAALDSKISEVRSTLEESKKLRSEAEALLAEATLEVSKFDIKKTHLLENAKNSTQALVKLKEKELDAMLLRKKKSAMQAIENQKVKMSEQLLEELTDSTMNLVRKYLTQSQNNKTTDKELLKRLLKE